MATPSAYSLERLIEKEIKLYQLYLQLMTEERAVTTRFNAEKILSLAEKREYTLIEMKMAHEERLALCREFPQGDKQKLITIIGQNFKGEERKRLIQCGGKLKALAVQSQKRTREFGIITRFGLGIVDGLLSILWSATKHVTKSYSRLGTVKESSTPAGNRESSVLKKA